MRTKVKILQSNRLDANSFLSKMWKASKKLDQNLWFEGPIKIFGTAPILLIWGSDKNFRDGGFFRDGQQPEAQKLFTPLCTVDWTRDWCSALQRSMLGAGKSTLQQTASRSCGSDHGTSDHSDPAEVRLIHAEFSFFFTGQRTNSLLSPPSRPSPPSIPSRYM